MEWDTAAGHAVLAAAGGTVVTADGAPLLYGKEASGFANPPFIAAAGHLGEVNRFSTTSP
jgi:3'(2'), 5'-bisphosphate nucleotidase